MKKILLLLFLILIPSATALFGFGNNPILMTQSNYFNSTNASVNQSTWWNDLFAIDGIYLYNISGVLSFNETRMNNTIQQFIRSTTYLPTAFYTPQSYVGGLRNLSYYDSDSLNISEGGGANPLTLYVNISNVTSLNQVIIREWYDAGTTSHTIDVAIWANNTGTWETYYTIYYQSGFNILTIPVLDAADHINNTVLQVRFNHPASGIMSHIFKVDWVIGQAGLNVLTTSDHDSLQGRDNVYSNHPSYADRYGYRNFTSINCTDGINANKTNVKYSNITVRQQIGSGPFPNANILELSNGANSYIQLVSTSTGTTGLDGLYFGADTDASIYSGFGENLIFYPVLDTYGHVSLQKDGTFNNTMLKSVTNITGTNILCNQTLGNCMNQNALLNNSMGYVQNNTNFNTSIITGINNTLNVWATNMTMFTSDGKYWIRRGHPTDTDRQTGECYNTTWMVMTANVSKAIAEGWWCK